MKINTIQKIEFFDREKEKEEIMNILRTEPQLINFIYGPINSGKTTLITNLIENLPENYVVFYINLRKRPISTYKDFLEVMFDVKYEGILSRLIRLLGRRGDIVSDIISDLGKTHGIPIPKGIFSRIFKEEKPENAFVYILNLIKDAKSKGKIPVLIIDELQVIGDLEVDGKLIYKLFNFFIALTKELHICHVFALSSDSLFIEHVYNEAMLYERSHYILVDNFEDEVARKFLKKYKFNEDEIKLTLKYVGGKPILLRNMISIKQNGKSIEEEINKYILKRTGEIKQILYYVEKFGKTITFGEKEVSLSYPEIIKILENFKVLEIFIYDVITPEIFYLVKENILVIDSQRRSIKPQSRIDLIAIREILK